LQAFEVDEEEDPSTEDATKAIEQQSAFSKVMNWKIGGGSSVSSSAYTPRKVGSVASGTPYHLRHSQTKEMRFPKPKKVQDPSLHSQSQNTADKIQVARPFPTDTEIVSELRCIVNDQNLENTSRKELRTELERRFGFDLSDKKKLIYEELSKMV
jgi:DEK C terminal domain